jgi:hypothetical protein
MGFYKFQNQPLLILLSVIVGVLFLITRVEAASHTNVPHPADPFADPKNDPYNPLRYITSNVLTGVSFGGWI